MEGKTYERTSPEEFKARVQLLEAQQIELTPKVKLGESAVQAAVILDSNAQNSDSGPAAHTESVD